MRGIADDDSVDEDRAASRQRPSIYLGPIVLQVTFRGQNVFKNAPQMKDCSLEEKGVFVLLFHICSPSRDFLTFSDNLRFRRVLYLCSKFRPK